MYVENSAAGLRKNTTRVLKTWKVLGDKKQTTDLDVLVPLCEATLVCMEKGCIGPLATLLSVTLRHNV
jgi:hypothetical protein